MKKNLILILFIIIVLGAALYIGKDEVYKYLYPKKYSDYVEFYSKEYNMHTHTPGIQLFLPAEHHIYCIHFLPGCHLCNLCTHKQYAIRDNHGEPALYPDPSSLV